MDMMRTSADGKFGRLCGVGVGVLLERKWWSMPNRRTSLGIGRRERKEGAVPPWFVALGVEEGRYRDARDDLERIRARRSLMMFLAYRYFGASQGWLAEQMGTRVSNINRLIDEGKTVALSGVGEGDLEKLVAMCFGAGAVGLGWDGAGGGA